jgi:hypothetical protein
MGQGPSFLGSIGPTTWKPLRRGDSERWCLQNALFQCATLMKGDDIVPRQAPDKQLTGKWKGKALLYTPFFAPSVMSNQTPGR